MTSDEDDESEEENELLNEDHAKDMMARFVKKKEIDSDIEDQEDDIPDGRAWGRKRQDFYDNDYDVKDSAGFAISEQDREIAKMEEEEALAIQKRLAEEVDEDVFGLDDLQEAPEEDEDSKKIEVLDLSKLPRKKLLRMVEEESPELQGLIEDCRDKLRELAQELTPIMDLFKSGKLPRGSSAEDYVLLRHNLLLSYATNVCFYLNLKAKRVNIKNHPIIKRLGQFKKLITELDNARGKLLPQIQVIIERTKNGELLKVRGEEADPESTDGEDIDDEDEVGAQLSDLQNDPGEEQEDGDGRRAINYQIAKNKGLTPRRKKEYRNPRVRHRIKYRKANIRRKGQVRAMRNESGHYGGETSGINKRVVKSVKLK
ncbi:something about silencing protein 10 [Galendromus occidentalis]|uniref:Something about silencing protein 10 n=1 Tax=Galendromus occidentalis TaxID=34638 RepID=A0AAJ7SEI8_9ACAR|nr:something about silencing protein 10 [Galendromus occidentalis]